MVELFANSGDPDQTPRSAASDLGLRCLPITFVACLGVFRLQWFKLQSWRTRLVLSTYEPGREESYRNLKSYSSEW